MESIKQYKQNKKEVSKIYEEFKKFEKEQNNKSWEIEIKARDKIHEIERKKYKDVQKVKDETTKEDLKKKEKIEKLREHINKVDKILNLIGIHRDKEKSLNYEVYYYDYPKNKDGNDKIKYFLKPIEVLKDNEFIKVGVYIYENDKPTNKYTLAVLGNTIFNEKTLKIPYSYGIKIHNENARIREVIKFFPTEKSLKEWFEKNKEKVLKDFFEEHKKTEEEYKKVIKEFLTKPYIKLYLEQQLYYYENQYSQGTETDEYKAIQKELKEL